MPSETTDEIFLNDIFNTYIPKIIQDDVFEQGNLAGSVDFEGQDQVFSPVSTRPATWIGRSCSAWQSFDSVDCKVDFSYSPDTRQGNIFEDNDIFEYSVSLAQYQDFSSPSTEATIRAANSLLVQPNIDSIGFGINDPYLSDTIEASILGNEHGFERPNFIRPDQMFSTINTDLVIQSDQTKSGDSNSIQRENADQHFGLDHISVLDKSTNNERIVKETHFSAAQRTALKPHSFETCTSVFSAHPSAGRIRKRRRLEPGPRKATSEVRRIGACLGCMLGKRRVSYQMKLFVERF